VTAVAERGDLVVTDWENELAPRLNGEPLAMLVENERCRCVDIATGGMGIVLGTEWRLHCIDARGRERWQQRVQATVWCVKIDDYNQVVAAALGDGTIRWYRFHDGAPLLTLYLHPDARRWVMWTPSGYFDCAPGAEELLGWHVNNGPDRAADYFPLSKFRQAFYQPAVIDRIFDTLDEQAAVEQAGQATGRGILQFDAAAVLQNRPPVVRIHRPTDGETVSGAAIAVEYSLESPDAEITAVRMLVDGRPASVERGAKPTGQRLQASITLPDDDVQVSIIAENRYGAGEPATVRVVAATSVAASSRAAETGIRVDLRPRLYALAVGVGAYGNAAVRPLGLAAKDARDFAETLRAQHDKLYCEVTIRLLTDAEATKDAILDGLDWLQRETTARDVAMLYFAGHGLDDNSGNFYYLPVGADPAALRRTGLSRGDVQSTVASVAGKMLVFMDACHSGGLMQSIERRGTQPDLTSVINELVAAENGAVVFSSATTRQYALERPDWGNGAFTKALIEGLGGEARTPGQEKVTVKTLDAYVAERVKRLTEGQQSPVTAYPPNVPDFPVAVP
jgi:hypothetical protein